MYLNDVVNKSIYLSINTILIFIQMINRRTGLRLQDIACSKIQKNLSNFIQQKFIKIYCSGDLEIKIGSE